MKKIALQLLAGVALLGQVVGCGNSAPNAAQGPVSGQESLVASTGDPSQADLQSELPPPEPVPIAAEECANPDVAVQTFLDTLRAGDDRKAASLLTTKARVETHRRGMAVQPPGSPTAKYAVKKASFTSRNRDTAEVASVWTEQIEAGDVHNYEVTWLLRLEPEGWRVAGMATELVPGKGPQPLNFEDPEDMQHQIESAEQALAEQEAQEAQQAKTPPDRDTFRR